MKAAALSVYAATEPTLQIVVESGLVVAGVIWLVWCGVFIGREFGSFELWVEDIIERMKR